VDSAANVPPFIDGFKQALARIGAEHLSRQKAVRETFMQGQVVFALTELEEDPIQKISRPIGKDGKVARSDVQEMQGMLAAKGHAAAEGRAAFDDNEVEGVMMAMQQCDRRHYARESATDNANRGMRLVHDVNLADAKQTKGGRLRDGPPRHRDRE
jgi:hypothetical protein